MDTCKERGIHKDLERRWLKSESFPHWFLRDWSCNPKYLFAILWQRKNLNISVSNILVIMFSSKQSRETWVYVRGAGTTWQASEASTSFLPSCPVECTSSVSMTYWLQTMSFFIFFFMVLDKSWNPYSTLWCTSFITCFITCYSLFIKMCPSVPHLGHRFCWYLENSNMCTVKIISNCCCTLFWKQTEIMFSSLLQCFVLVAALTLCCTEEMAHIATLCKCRKFCPTQWHSVNTQHHGYCLQAQRFMTTHPCYATGVGGGDKNELKENYTFIIISFLNISL